MSFVWSTARKDWTRQRRDPMAFVLWLGIPLVIGTLMTLLSGGKEGPKPQAHVLVADLDDTFLSGFLVGALSQERTGGFVHAESVELADGRARMENGDATALLVIPAGFSRAVLAEEPSELELATNPAQRILPGIVEEMLSLFTDGVFYLQRLLGDDLRRMADGPAQGNTFPDEWIAEFSVKINRIVDGLDGTVFPPVIQIAFGPEKGPAAEAADSTAATTAETTAAAPDKKTSMALLFLPGLLFMSLLFTAQGVAGDLWREREQHTLRRVLVAPRRAWTVLGGKLLAGCGVMFVICAVALGVGFAYFGIGAARLPLALVWGTFSGGILLVMMLLLQLLASSPRGGSALTMTLVFPLMMLGGSFFPFEAMPDWMRAIGAWTPNGWALLHLKSILSGTESAGALGRAFGGLVLVAALMFTLAGRRLDASFGRG